MPDANPSNCLDIPCPIQFTLNIVGGKWSLLILRELFIGDRRTHQFLDALPGISTKTLTARLRALESHGIVKRQVFPEMPPRVEYSLTPKGREIQPILLALHQLGESWLKSNNTSPLQAIKDTEALNSGAQPSQLSG